MAAKDTAEPAETVATLADPGPVEPSLADLPPLRQVLAKKVIPRDNGPDIVPGQSVWLPKAMADDAIKSGHAVDPAKAG